jgi:ABC-type glycerol-3-phosphate transport system permease component
MIDGAGPVRTFFQVVFPSSSRRPSPSRSSTPCGWWNDYLLPTDHRQRYKTIPVASSTCAADTVRWIWEP